MATKKKKAKKKAVKKKSAKKKVAKKKVAKKKAVKKKTAKKKVTKKKATKKKAVKKKAAKKKVAKKKASAKKKATSKKTKPVKTKAAASKSSAKKGSAWVAPSKVVEKLGSGRAKQREKHDWLDIFVPLYDGVLVQIKTETIQEKTVGGIIIPKSSQKSPNKAEVLSVGIGRRNKHGKIFPLDVKVGETVLLSRHSGQTITIRDQKLLLLKEHEILGVVD